VRSGRVAAVDCPGAVDLARWRLRSQLLVGPGAPGAEAVVSSLLAVQAENAGQSAWAVAARTAVPDAADLAGLLDTGRVLRTHVLRPTWHYVAARDVAWLVEVTAPRIRPQLRRQLEGVADLDQRRVARASDTVLQALEGGRERTRAELAEDLAAAGLPLAGHPLMVLMADLELRALVCSGRIGDGEHRYALLSERVPRPRRLARDEALA
jgi:hypothetical protein